MLLPDFLEILPTGDSFVENIKFKWRIFIKKQSLPNGMRIMDKADGIKRKLYNLEILGRAIKVGRSLKGVY